MKQQCIRCKNNIYIESGLCNHCNYNHDKISFISYNIGKETERLKEITELKEKPDIVYIIEVRSDQKNEIIEKFQEYDYEYEINDKKGLLVKPSGEIDLTHNRLQLLFIKKDKFFINKNETDKINIDDKEHEKGENTIFYTSVDLTIKKTKKEIKFIGIYLGWPTEGIRQDPNKWIGYVNAVDQKLSKLHDHRLTIIVGDFNFYYEYFTYKIRREMSEKNRNEFNLEKITEKDIKDFEKIGYSPLKITYRGIFRIGKEYNYTSDKIINVINERGTVNSDNINIFEKYYDFRTKYYVKTIMAMLADEEKGYKKFFNDINKNSKLYLINGSRPTCCNDEIEKHIGDHIENIEIEEIKEKSNLKRKLKKYFSEKQLITDLFFINKSTKYYNLLDKKFLKEEPKKLDHSYISVDIII